MYRFNKCSLLLIKIFVLAISFQFAFSGNSFIMSATGGPTLFYLDVESGPPGVFVTLNGWGFSINDLIKIGDTVATALPAVNQYTNYTPETVPSKVTVSVPDLPDGNYAITVQTAQGTSNSLDFTVRPGNVYYVAKNGSDSNSGTRDDPWLTLDFAIRQLSAGDFVYVREGTYRENTDKVEDGIWWGDNNSTSYTIRGVTGEPEKPITVQAYPGETALFTMQAYKPGTFNIVGANYLNFVGLTMAHIEAGGINVSSGSHHIRIVNNELYDIAWVSYGTGAIWVWIDTDRVHMLGNSLHDIGEKGSNIMHSMYIEGDNMLVAYNKIYDEPGGIEERQATSGIQFFGRSEPVRGAVVHNNLIYGMYKRGIQIAGEVGDALIYNNIIRDNGEAGLTVQNDWQTSIVNNTFSNNGWRSTWDGMFNHILASTNKTTNIKNNIFYSAITNFTIKTSGSGPYDIDYNLYYNTQGAPREAPGEHSLIADPLLVDPTRGDVRLKEDSPAIDAGIDVGLPYAGAAPDLGALEFGSVAAPVNESGSQPENFDLHQNYPNPFNPTTKIVYDIPIPSFVKIKIFDLLGREITKLVNEQKNTGTYEVKWDGRNSKGEVVASGVYLYTLKIVDAENSQTLSETKKMILLH